MHLLWTYMFYNVLIFNKNLLVITFIIILLTYPYILTHPLNLPMPPNLSSNLTRIPPQ